MSKILVDVIFGGLFSSPFEIFQPNLSDLGEMGVWD